MKKLIIILIMSILTIATNAQSKQTNKVASAAEALRVAMVNSDSAALVNLVADSLSYGHSGGYIEGKKEFVTKLTNGASDFVTIDITNQTIKMFGNTAVVRHLLSATTNDNGKPGTVKLSVLQVWQLTKKRWQLIARQAVKQV